MTPKFRIEKRANNQFQFRDANDWALYEIFKRCDPTTVGRCAAVCRRWRRIIEDKYYSKKHASEPPSTARMLARPTDVDLLVGDLGRILITDRRRMILERVYMGDSLKMYELERRREYEKKFKSINFGNTTTPARSPPRSPPKAFVDSVYVKDQVVADTKRSNWAYSFDVENWIADYDIQEVVLTNFCMFLEREIQEMAEPIVRPPSSRESLVQATNFTSLNTPPWSPAQSPISNGIISGAHPSTSSSYMGSEREISVCEVNNWDEETMEVELRSMSSGRVERLAQALSPISPLHIHFKDTTRLMRRPIRMIFYTIKLMRRNLRRITLENLCAADPIDLDKWLTLGGLDLLVIKEPALNSGLNVTEQILFKWLRLPEAKRGKIRIELDKCRGLTPEGLTKFVKAWQAAPDYCEFAHIQIDCETLHPVEFLAYILMKPEERLSATLFREWQNRRQLSERKISFTNEKTGGKIHLHTTRQLMTLTCEAPWELARRKAKRETGPDEPVPALKFRPKTHIFENLCRFPAISPYEPSIKLPISEWFWVNLDNFHITCLTNHTLEPVFKRQFMGLRDSTRPEKYIRGKRAIPTPRRFDLKSLSVHLLVLDSTSRTQFQRHMPGSYAKMLDMGFVVLNGYNKVGDNSNVNLLPIIADPLAEAKNYPTLTKEGEIEMANILPYNESINPDTIPFIWKRMSARGCETLFNDDVMDTRRGILHYPSKYFMPGFSKKPTDHYYRPFYTNFYEEVANKWKICYNGRMMPYEFADTWARFVRFTADKCAFSFNFITSTTHDNPNNLQVLNEYLLERLREFEKNESLESSVLLIMGDHGQRVHVATHSFAGRIEERTPFMAIYLPKKLRSTYPAEMQILADNANRFTSNFDVHETLLDLIDGKIGSGRPNSRGSSLFLKIPANRTCLQNNVVSTFCLCMEELPKTVPKKPTSAQIIPHIKKYLRAANCLDVDTLRCASDLSYLTLPKMALLGRRSLQDVDDQLKKTVKYTYCFVEARCEIKAAGGGIYKLQIQVENRLNSSEFTIPHTPHFQDKDNKTVLWEQICNV
ncbi:unnamed protein product, partial [Mesorhabditis spiculigera]